MATILIVDDHVLNRDFLHTLLGYGGHKMLEAGSGLEALALLQQQKPDLIIADVRMPNMDGYELIARIQSEPANASIPIIIYTAAYYEHEASIIARACGAGWVLPKPSEPQAILATVQQALGLPPPAEPPAPPSWHNTPPPAQVNRFSTVASQVAEYQLALEASQLIITRQAQSQGQQEGAQPPIDALLAGSLSSLQTISLRLTALIELGIDLAAEREADSLVEIGAEAARKICQAGYATVALLDENAAHVRYLGASGLDAAERRGLRYPSLRTGVLGGLLEQSRPRRVILADGDPQALGFAASHPLVFSFLGVPIATPTRSFGWLYLANKDRQADAGGFNEVDERVATTIAAQLAVAYESVALVDQLKREMAERQLAQGLLRGTLRARTVLSECSHVLVHATDEASLLLEMCRKVVEAGKYRMAWIAYAGPDGSLLPMAQAESGHAQSTFPPNWIAREHGWSKANIALQQGVASLVPDILLEASLREWQTFAIQRNYRASLSLPMMDGEQAFGVLTIYENEAHAFDDEHVAMFQELANDIAYGVASIRTRIAHTEAEHALRAAQHFSQATIDALSIHVLVLDEGGSILMVNRALCQFAGHNPTGQNYLAICACSGGPMEAEALSFAAGIRAVLQNETDEFNLEYPSRTSAGQRWFLGRVTRFGEDDSVRIVVMHEEITERKAYESHIEYLATHDTLTGLANRTLLADRLNQAMRHAQRSGTMLALLFLDLDRFKDVNDSYGHNTGDLLLTAVAARLAGLLRSEDSLARLGGDEFVILLADLQDPQHVSTIAGKILQSFESPFVIDGRVLHMNTSIGATVYPNDGGEIGILLRNADSAMYRAKQGSGSAFQFYSPDMGHRALARSEMENALRGAISRQEFLLHYQPKIALGSGRVIGAEALLRWEHPLLGLVMPDQFIALAEETGLIVPIGAWVLQQACRQAQAWQQAGQPGLRMSVNISARQFGQPELVEQVTAALHDSGLAADCLELELTESMLMQNAGEFIDKMRALKNMGVHLSIDDFGTGYSSLSYLTRFPIDTLKIDREFIQHIADDPSAAAITSAVISLGHSLKLKVIAEGVETHAQLDFLRQHGCDEMQGFLFSRAVLPGDFDALRGLRQSLAAE